MRVDRQQAQRGKETRLQRREAGPHHAPVDRDDRARQCPQPALARQSRAQCVGCHECNQEAGPTQHLPGYRKITSQKVHASQEQRPQRRGRARRGFAGVERQAVTPRQVTRELKVDPGVVQRHPALAAGEAIGGQRQDAQRQATGEQQGRQPAQVAPSPPHPTAHVTPRYIPPSTSKLTPVM